jgi:hypothetical protein
VEHLTQSEIITRLEAGELDVGVFKASDAVCLKHLMNCSENT